MYKMSVHTCHNN